MAKIDRKAMNKVQVIDEKEPDVRIIEVQGIKMEVDMRYAKKIENYKIGTQVRILKKEYGDEYKTYAGVIIGFEAFKKCPSILVAYLKTSYGSAEIEFLTFNNETKNIEMCIAEAAFIPFEKSTIIDKLNEGIQSAEQSLLEAKSKKEYFMKYFNEYFAKDYKQA